MAIEDKCFLCGGKIIAQCGCEFHDTFCENRHIYHRCVETGEIHEGESLHHIQIIDCCIDKNAYGKYLCVNGSQEFIPYWKAFDNVNRILKSDGRVCDTITMQTKYENLGMVKDEWLMLLFKICTELGVEVSLDNVVGFSDVGDIVRYINYRYKSYGIKNK